MAEVLFKIGNEDYLDKVIAFIQRIQERNYPLCNMVSKSIHIVLILTILLSCSICDAQISCYPKDGEDYGSDDPNDQDYIYSGSDSDDSSAFDEDPKFKSQLSNNNDAQESNNAQSQKGRNLVPDDDSDSEDEDDPRIDLCTTPGNLLHCSAKGLPLCSLDDFGRKHICEFIYPHNGVTRITGTKADRSISKDRYLSCDQYGHIMARRFCGQGIPYNIIPLNAYVI